MIVIAFSIIGIFVTIQYLHQFVCNRYHSVIDVIDPIQLSSSSLQRSTKIFPVQTELLSSERMMTENEVSLKRFKCEQCPKDYASKSGLTSHVKTKHQEVRLTQVEKVGDLNNLNAEEVEALLEEEEEFMDAVEVMEENLGLNMDLESVDGSLINFWQENNLKFTSTFAKTLELEQQKGDKEKIEKELEAAKKKIDLLEKKVKSDAKKMVEVQKKLEVSEKENKDMKRKIEKKKEIVEIEEDDDVVVVEVKCVFCDFVGRDQKNVRGHIKFAHCRCNDCGKKFFNYEQMEEHLREVHDVGSYICFHCKVSYESMGELEKHLQGGHKEAAPERREGGFECPKCNYVEDSEEDLRKHMVSNHLDEERPLQRVVRTRTCRWWKQGFCRDGNNCNFSHTGEQRNVRTEEPVRREEQIRREAPRREEARRPSREEVSCTNGPTCTWLARGTCHFKHSQGVQGGQGGGRPQGQQEASGGQQGAGGQHRGYRGQQGGRRQQGQGGQGGQRGRCWADQQCKRVNCPFVHTSLSDFPNLQKSGNPKVWNTINGKFFN